MEVQMSLVALLVVWGVGVIAMLGFVFAVVEKKKVEGEVGVVLSLIWPIALGLAISYGAWMKVLERGEKKKAERLEKEHNRPADEMAERRARGIP